MAAARKTMETPLKNTAQRSAEVPDSPKTARRDVPHLDIDATDKEPGVWFWVIGGLMSILVAVFGFAVLGGAVSKYMHKSDRPPLCDASGVCKETPTVASPRTLYTASADQLATWITYQSSLAAAARERIQKRQELKSTSKSILFIGDSILESFRETQIGDPTERAKVLLA
eukprot:g29860.t1